MRALHNLLSLYIIYAACVSNNISCSAGSKYMIYKFPLEDLISKINVKDRKIIRPLELLF
jgi:hypothetical protein